MTIVVIALGIGLLVFFLLARRNGDGQKTEENTSSWPLPADFSNSDMPHDPTRHAHHDSPSCLTDHGHHDSGTDFGDHDAGGFDGGHHE